MRWILLLLFVSISYAQVLEREDEPILKHSNFREIIHTSTSEGFFDVPYDFEVNSGVELTYQYTNVYQLLLNRSAKIVVETVNATNSNPVLIVVRQKKDVMAWQHPLIVSTHAGVNAEYQKVSRTICPSKFYSSYAIEFTEDENLLVTASTSSPVNVTVRLTVEFVDDFYLSLSEEKNITVSPSQPSFYGYLFSNDTETIFLAVNSEDRACITVSVQNIDCPIYDLEKNVKFEGKWETMVHKGGMTLKIDRNQVGFFVVFVVNSYDAECSGLPGSGDEDHQSTLSFILTPGLSVEEYLEATLGVFLVFLILFYLPFGILMYYKHRNTIKTIGSNTFENCAQEDIATVTENSRTQQQIPASEHANSAYGNEREISEEEVARKISWNDAAIKLFHHASKKKSQLYLWITILAATFYFVPTIQRVVTHQLVLYETGNQDLCYYNFRCAHPLGKLSDFSHVFSNFGYILLGLLFIVITKIHQNLYEKQSSHAYHHKNQEKHLHEKFTYPRKATEKYDPRAYNEERKNYVIVNNGLSTIQSKVNKTKRRQRPDSEKVLLLKQISSDVVAEISAFHHVIPEESPGYSSSEINRNSKYNEESTLAVTPGYVDKLKRVHKLPQHFGLFYAMGAALVAEGLLSGAYHICPRGSNFQFDTTFMYVTAMLCVVKIYKNRNQEVYATATTTFMFLGVVTFIVMLGNIIPSIYLSACIGLCQILISLVISVQLYYLGHISKGWNNIKRMFNLWRNGCCQFKCRTPRNKRKLVLLLLVNILNWVIAILGVLGVLGEVANYMLTVFIGNLILFFGFYVIKKYKHLYLRYCDKKKQNRTGEENGTGGENINRTYKNDQGESSTNPLAVNLQDTNNEERKEFQHVGEDFIKDLPPNQRKANETRKRLGSETVLLLKETPSDIAAGASSSHQTTESENPGCSSGAINRSSYHIEEAIPEVTAGDRNNTAESHSKESFTNLCLKFKEPNIYLIATALLWLPALYFFFSSSTSWEETPAISRNKNEDCIFFKFYDTHDLWHLFSAASLFFTFMVLLTLNDHLIETP